MECVLDLTELSTTIPSPPPDEIPRDSIIQYFEDQFREDHCFILLKDAPRKGKTTFLAQFARHHAERTIAYFTGDDYWSSNQRHFLTEIGIQMQALRDLHKHGVASQPQIDYSRLSDGELVQCVTELYRDLKHLAKFHGPFFFAVDAVDRLQKEVPLKLLPSGDQVGIYVIASTTERIQEFPYRHLPSGLPPFSTDECVRYLTEAFSEQDATAIAAAAQGSPGYLAEIKRQKLKGATVDPHDLPAGLELLLDKQLSRIGLDNEDVRLLLGLISMAPEALTIEELAKVIGKPANEISSLTERVGIAYEDKHGKVRLEAGYSSLLAKRFSPDRDAVYNLLIDDYERHPNMTEAYTHLPVLYRETGRYDSLVRLIDATFVVQGLATSKSTLLIRRNLSILSAMANQRKDWQRLACAVLMETLLSHIAGAPSEVEDRVRALLAIDRANEAFAITNAAVIPEDRLKLLSAICGWYRSRGHCIPPSIMRYVDETLSLIDTEAALASDLLEELLDVAAPLFPISPPRVQGLIANIAASVKDPDQSAGLHDALMVKLLLRLRQESTEQVGVEEERLGRQRGEKALYGMRGVRVSEVLSASAQLTDSRSRMLLLQIWCEVNAENEDAYLVVEAAISAIESTKDWTPSQLHLWKLARALHSCKSHDVSAQLIGRFDFLKSTALANPVGELARLEVELASIQSKWSQDETVSRLYELYYRFESEENVAHRCTVLAHLLKASVDLLPEDRAFHSELSNCLEHTISNLLANSADQLVIIRPTIEALTEYDLNRALVLATSLNTEARRNAAVVDALRHHARTCRHSPQLDLVSKGLSLITDLPLRDWAFTSLLATFCDTTTRTKSEIMRFAGPHLSSLSSSYAKCFVNARLIRWLWKHDQKLCKVLHSAMHQALESVDTLWERVSLGFQLCTIVAEVDVELASETYGKVATLPSQSVFYDERLASAYLEICGLVVRLFTDSIHTERGRQNFDMILRLIQSVPSAAERCQLYSTVSLRCHRAEKLAFFTESAKLCLAEIENVSGIDDKFRVVRVCAPMLFLYSDDMLYEYAESFSNDRFDQIMTSVTQYIMTKRPSEDEVPLDKVAANLQPNDINHICKILQRLKTDAAFYATVSAVIDNLITERNDQTVLPERQVLKLAEQVKEYRDQKLPDVTNIKHEGYKVITSGALAELRDAYPHQRSKARWSDVCPPWEDLRSQASAIGNPADRAYVLTILGKRAYSNNNTLGNALLEDAEKTLEHIHNHVDYAGRHHVITEGYAKSKPAHALKYFLEKSLSNAQLCSRAEGRDLLIGRILELAYATDSALSSTLAAQISDRSAQWDADSRMLSLKLRYSPSKIDDYDNEQMYSIFPHVCQTQLETIYSGKATIHHVDVFGNWLKHALGHSFRVASRCVTIYVENVLLSKGLLRNSMLDGLASGLNGVAQVILQLGTTLAIDAAYAATPTTILGTEQSTIFHVGQKSRAMDEIRSWLHKNASNRVTIYDPYFDEHDLYILMQIPQSASVLIMTSASEKDAAVLSTRYKASWASICEQAPPSTSVCVFTTPSGQTDMHDRFILCDEAGIQIGTSLNGLGNKNSMISKLSAEEFQDLNSFVMSSVTFPKREHKGQPMNRIMFTLE